MPLLGTGAVIMWSDMADPATHDAWHSHEHLPERIGIPGFRRGRRAAATTAGAPSYFVLYELSDPAIAVSAPYLERLDNPTAWTRRTMEVVRSLSRTLCQVTATHGRGVGTHSLTIRLTPADGEDARLRDWLASEALPALAATPGLIGAHLLERDRTTERPETNEQRMRPVPDSFVDWVILLEGYDRQAVIAANAQELSPAALIEHGAEHGTGRSPVLAFYELAHLITPNDLAVR
ncbi:hypothetical protein [Azospirillum melinis]